MALMSKLPTALSPGQRQLTISIEGTSIRVMVCHGRRVETWASVPFPTHLLRNGFVANPGGVGEALKLALKNSGTAKGPAVAALSGLQTMSRIITLPSMGKSQIRAALPREVKRLMPFSGDNTYVQWQALPGSSARKQFFVLAVPKEPTLSLIESLASAGVKVRSLDARPMALARAVNVDNAIVACVENITIDIVIVVQGIPVVSRSLLTGEQPVTSDEALPRLLDELGRSLSFYNSTFRDNPLPADLPIYLCGVLSRSGMAPAVSDALARPVMRPAPPLTYPSHWPVEEFTVNAGLALKAL